MNNIYKVIWSKAKNCYVVASEIAKSHTKSASGSEKMGGYGKKALLALAAASAIFCGGLVNVGATATVADTSGTNQIIYTQSEVDTELGKKADKTDVEEIKNTVGGVDSGLVKKTNDNATGIEVNRTSINALKDTVGDDTKGLTKKINDNATAINTLTTNVNAKADANTVNDISTRVGTLETTVGNDTGGLVKDVNEAKTDITNIKNTIGDASNGLVKNVAALETKVGDASSGLVKDVADLKNQRNDLNTAIGNKADQSGLDAANAKITDLQAKTANLSADGKELTGMTTVSGAKVSGDNVEAGALTVTGKIKDGAGVTTTLAKINDSMTQTATNTGDITDLKTKTDGQQTAINGLDKKTTKITYDAALGTNVDGVTFNAGKVTGVTSINGTEIGTKESGTYIHQDSSIWGNMKNVDTQVTTNADNIKKNKDDITKLDAKVGTVGTGEYLDPTKSVGENLGRLDAGLKKEVDDRTAADDALSGRITDNAKEIARVNQELVNTNNHFNTELGNTNAALQAEGQARANADAALANDITATNKRTAGIGRTDTGVEADNQTVIEGKVHFDQNGNVSGVKDLKTDTIHATGEINTTGKVSAGDVSTGTLETTGNAKIGGDLTVDGKLNVGEIYLENNKLESTGKKHDSATSITADGISNLAKVTELGHTTESQFTHNEKGTFNHAKDGNTTDWKEATSNVTADGVENIAKDSKGNNNTFTQTSTDTKNILKDKDGNTSTTRQDSKGIYGYAKDKDGNESYTKQEGNRIAESVIGQDGKETKSEMTSTDITNTAKAGTITSDAKDIVNKATGNIFNSSATMDTTVTGKATESYGELETEVKGNEKHTVKGDQTNEVDGKQINTIKNGQENIISGGQTNTITGGQINNITGDQTTTITGNKKETVTENVTEDYKKDLTTTVGGNETHEVKGTKTETVEGKLTENFKGGQETNVTGDQTTNVSGTQTTTATDIKRNASSGMIDTIDNDYGTNTETKVAGSTTTEVSIKGTNESGTYIRGATEARDYIIKGTLSNSETKTAEATSSEITDGTNTASTRQDAKNLAGSVTNGTETGVSGIHAKDNSVSIDSIVTDGNKSYSVINQKKGSIQSTVVDGTSSTVILQDKDNVTIASSNGMVGIVGKDIVNNAQNTITNTAGTSITNQVNDSKVTTDANGTTFENNTPAVSDGGATTTKINGNQITTGRVDANELGVSDKDGANTADFSVKAGEGIKSSATDKDGNTTYTKVTATENSFQVQDKDGKNKNHQVNTKDKSENTITNGDKTNTVTSTADGTTFNNSKANTAFEGGTYTDTTIKGNTITTGKVTMDYAEVMKDLGVHGNAKVDQNLEVGGTSTLKGDVTMESNATVKKDLKVEGTTTTKTLKVTENATVGGTLDVTQKATFHDDVDIKKNLSVDGNATIAGDVTANSYKVGDKTYIDANGINANDQKITNVADGSISEGSKDAVNGGQLYGVKRDLEHQVDKVGANAAAMANLRPMEFDPSSKWNIAAAIGNYGSETAAALGAFYRPNDDVMVNLSTAFGTGENMVGGGVSVRLGKSGNKLSREENNALKAQVDDLTARMDALLSVLNPNMSKDFPDVPENHWAYEAVSRLAGNDIVQGYPDGEFHGERTMTRYEMAEIIYNALSRGAEAERELVEEFKPELQAMAASEKATAEKAEG